LIFVGPASWLRMHGPPGGENLSWPENVGSTSDARSPPDSWYGTLLQGHLQISPRVGAEGVSGCSTWACAHAVPDPGRTRAESTTSAFRLTRPGPPVPRAPRRNTMPSTVARAGPSPRLARLPRPARRLRRLRQRERGGPPRGRRHDHVNASDTACEGEQGRGATPARSTFGREQGKQGHEFYLLGTGDPVMAG